MNRSEKVADVVAKFDGKSIEEQYVEKKNKLARKRVKLREEEEKLESWIEKQRENCSHTDDGGIFYGFCKKCGKDFG